MLYILNLKDPHHFCFKKLLRLYWGLNQGPSDLEADDIPMCLHASLISWKLLQGVCNRTQKLLPCTFKGKPHSSRKKAVFFYRLFFLSALKKIFVYSLYLKSKQLLRLLNIGNSSKTSNNTSVKILELYCWCIAWLLAREDNATGSYICLGYETQVSILGNGLDST